MSCLAPKCHWYSLIQRQFPGKCLWAGHFCRCLSSPRRSLRFGFRKTYLETFFSDICRQFNLPRLNRNVSPLSAVLWVIKWNRRYEIKNPKKDVAPGANPANPRTRSKYLRVFSSFSVFIKLQQALELQAWRGNSKNLAADVFSVGHADGSGAGICFDFYWEPAGRRRGDCTAVFLSASHKERVRPLSSKGHRGQLLCRAEAHSWSEGNPRNWKEKE